MKKSMRYIALGLVGVFLGCRGNEQNGDVVAQVGKSRLTTNELRIMVPHLDELRLSKSQVENLVKGWVESELIYQEALRVGLAKDEQVQRELAKMKRDFLVAQYIEKYIDERTEVSQQEAEAYYRDHIEEFQCAEDEYHIRLILVMTLSEATQIRSQLAQGEDFAQWAEKRSMDGSRLNGGDLGFVPLSRLSPLLARAVAQMRRGELSLPVKSEIGYNLLTLLEMRKKGEAYPMEEVRGMIGERVQAQKKGTLYQEVIHRLSESMDLKTDLNIIFASQSQPRP
jgi:peptidyl-prolyl cis-trans isomerase C